MLVNISGKPISKLTAFAGLLVFALLCGLAFLYFKKQKDTCKVGVIISQTDFSEKDIKVVKFMLSRKLQSLNKSGEIDGKPLEVIYLDDKGNKNNLLRLVNQTVQDKNLIAYIGCQGFDRAITLGPVLTRENVPFIGNYVYTQYIKKYPTMYSSGLGITEGKIVFGKLLQAKAKKVGFIGEKNSSSASFTEGIKSLQAQAKNFEFTYLKMHAPNHIFSTSEVKVMVDSLKEKVDFLVFNSSLENLYPLLEGLEKADVKIPVFCGFVDIAQIDKSNPFFKAAELYDLDSYGIPGVHNKRLHEQYILSRKELSPDPSLEFQLGLAGAYADELGLIREAAQSSKSKPGNDFRTRINEGMRNYTLNKKYYRGWFSDWYFTPEHAIGGNTLIAWKPGNQAKPMLAPVQYLNTDSGYRKTEVLYTNLEMVQIDQVNDEAGSFYATFFLEFNIGRKLNFSEIDFTNAARNEINHQPMISATLIRSENDSLKKGYWNYLYKISGKFFFEPDLKRYPLDEQRFAISLESSNATRAFLVQPRVSDGNETPFEARGWNFKEQFVGYDQEIITTTGNFSRLQNNIPYYKFTYFYIMKRVQVDFLLKGLVPLLAILLITYLSVYIPPREFEALCAIQVTGLLSAIALYFAVYKPEVPYATISDKIFIFTYIMITSLIGTSILIYTMTRKNSRIVKASIIYQQYLFPILILAYTVFLRWFSA
jgi:hypothetical protein